MRINLYTHTHTHRNQKSVMILRKTNIVQITDMPFIIIEFLLLFTHRFDESSSDKEILDLLLEKKRYDKRLLPPVNGKKFLMVLLSALNFLIFLFKFSI